MMDDEHGSLVARFLLHEDDKDDRPPGKNREDSKDAGPPKPSPSKKSRKTEPGSDEDADREARWEAGPLDDFYDERSTGNAAGPLDEVYEERRTGNADREAKDRGKGASKNRKERKKMKAQALSKTKLCEFYRKGECIRGKSCQYAHDESELQPRPDMYKTRWCFAFMKSGKCKNGASCQFVHSEEELRGPLPGESSESRWPSEHELADDTRRSRSRRRSCSRRSLSMRSGSRRSRSRGSRSWRSEERDASCEREDDMNDDLPPAWEAPRGLHDDLPPPWEAPKGHPQLVEPPPSAGHPRRVEPPPSVGPRVVEPPPNAGHPRRVEPPPSAGPRVVDPPPQSESKHIPLINVPRPPEAVRPAPVPAPPPAQLRLPVHRQGSRPVLVLPPPGLAHGSDLPQRAHGKGSPPKLVLPPEQAITPKVEPRKVEPRVVEPPGPPRVVEPRFPERVQILNPASLHDLGEPLRHDLGEPLGHDLGEPLSQQDAEAGRQDIEEDVEEVDEVGAALMQDILEPEEEVDEDPSDKEVEQKESKPATPSGNSAVAQFLLMATGSARSDKEQEEEDDETREALLQDLEEGQEVNDDSHAPAPQEEPQRQPQAVEPRFERLPGPVVRPPAKNAVPRIVMPPPRIVWPPANTGPRPPANTGPKLVLPPGHGQGSQPIAQQAPRAPAPPAGSDPNRRVVPAPPPPAVVPPRLSVGHGRQTELERQKHVQGQPVPPPLPPQQVVAANAATAKQARRLKQREEILQWRRDKGYDQSTLHLERKAEQGTKSKKQGVRNLKSAQNAEQKVQQKWSKMVATSAQRVKQNSKRQAQGNSPSNNQWQAKQQKNQQKPTRSERASASGSSTMTPPPAPPPPPPAPTTWPHSDKRSGAPTNWSQGHGGDRGSAPPHWPQGADRASLPGDLPYGSSGDRPSAHANWSHGGDRFGAPPNYWPHAGDRAGAPANWPHGGDRASAPASWPQGVPPPNWAHAAPRAPPGVPPGLPPGAPPPPHANWPPGVGRASAQPTWSHGWGAPPPAASHAGGAPPPPSQAGGAPPPPPSHAGGAPPPSHAGGAPPPPPSHAGSAPPPSPAGGGHPPPANRPPPMDRAGAQTSRPHGRDMASAPSHRSQGGDSATTTTDRFHDGGGEEPYPRDSNSLSSVLTQLNDEDPAKLFTVRNFAWLGSRAEKVLKEHFESQGCVLKVLVTQHRTRGRRGSMGFIQMATVEGVRNVLSLGEDQRVKGIAIRVQPFGRQHIAEELGIDVEESHDAYQDDGLKVDMPPGNWSQGGFYDNDAQASQPRSKVEAVRAANIPRPSSRFTEQKLDQVDSDWL